jgi:hypothetical protein
MHLTLKKQTTRPPGLNALQQQARFDAFVREFNAERPHEALDMQRPADRYASSNRPYTGPPELSYPLHDTQYMVSACGRVCMHRKKINISTVLAGQLVGLKEVEEGIWLVSFMHDDLRYIDLEQKTLQPIDNPFGTRVSPISKLRNTVLPVSPGRTTAIWRRGWDSNPRYACTHNGFRDRPDRPLWHLSARRRRAL